MARWITQHWIQDTAPDGQKLVNPIFHGVTRTNPERAAAKSDRAYRKAARRAHADKVKPNRGPRVGRW